MKVSWLLFNEFSGAVNGRSGHFKNLGSLVVTSIGSTNGDIRSYPNNSTETIDL